MVCAVYPAADMTPTISKQSSNLNILKFFMTSNKVTRFINSYLFVIWLLSIQKTVLDCNGIHNFTQVCHTSPRLLPYRNCYSFNCFLEAHALQITNYKSFYIFSYFRTEVKLESLEDAVVLEDYADDLLSDKHGCPAYVSPEILRSNTQYSGRSADMWGLGVMLYTMLVGR